ncbi:MAG: hypothetical protein PGN29_08785 [Gordonia paraffinivorans]
MTTDHAALQWSKTADQRTGNVRQGIGLLVVFAAIAVLMVVTSYPFLAAAMAVMALSSIPVLVPAHGRIVTTKDTVVVRPRSPFVNTHYVFPVVSVLSAVLITAQLIITSPTGGDVRLPVVTLLFWLGAVIAAGATIRYRGSITVDANGFGINGRYRWRYDEVEFRLIQERKSAFPHLEVTPKNGPRRLFFPAKYYGLEANSVYSTLRHLAETDEETRRNYSPELIREMLLFTPDREVAVGESIEVRIVARPEARTA